MPFEVACQEEVLELALTRVLVLALLLDLEFFDLLGLGLLIVAKEYYNMELDSWNLRRAY